MSDCSQHTDFPAGRYLERMLRALVAAVATIGSTRAEAALAKVRLHAVKVEDALSTLRDELLASTACDAIDGDADKRVARCDDVAGSMEREAAQAVARKSAANAPRDIKPLLALMEQAERMVLEARFVAASASRGRSNGNVIELRRNHADLTDAEFERMLAASDVPQRNDASFAAASHTITPRPLPAGDKRKRSGHLTLVVNRALDGDKPASPR